MSAIINGSSPSVTFSDGTTQSTSAIVSGYVPYANLPAGSVLQVVSYSVTLSGSTTSSTLSTTSLATSITPKFSTSKILVRAIITASANGASTQPIFTIYRNSTNLATGSSYMGAIRNGASYIDGNVTMETLDSPATTSSTTYTVYGATNAGTAYWGNGMTSTITVMEIAG